MRHCFVNLTKNCKHSDIKIRNLKDAKKSKRKNKKQTKTKKKKQATQENDGESLLV